VETHGTPGLPQYDERYKKKTGARSEWERDLRTAALSTFSQPVGEEKNKKKNA